MEEILIAAFPERERADTVIDQLKEAGYRAEDVSIITRADHGIMRTSEKTGGGVGAGAVAGGTIGGVAGLLLAAMGIVIVGPISALLGLGGLIGTTLTGAVIGAATGGLVAALTQLGVPEDRAREYEDTVRSGGVILAVPIHDLTKENIRRILEDNGAEGTSEVDVREKEHQL